MNRLATFASVVMAFAWLATTASAQPADEETQSRRPDPDRRQRLMEEFDADDDGQLSEEERQRARERMRDRRRDGGPGRSAIGDRGPDRERRRGDRPRPDGPADERPRFAGPRAVDGRPDGPPGPGRPPVEFIDPRELFDQFDENKDDQLSREEFLSLSVEVAKLRAERFARRGPPAGRGFGPPAWRGERPMPQRMGRPDLRPRDRGGDERPGRGRPPREDSAEAPGAERPSGEAPI